MSFMAAEAMTCCMVITQRIQRLHLLQVLRFQQDILRIITALFPHPHIPPPLLLPLPLPLQMNPQTARETISLTVVQAMIF